MVTEKLILKTEAVFSDDGKHRYLLSKEWDKTKKSAMVIMKNPNNADKSDSIILACGSILETNKQVQNRYDELMNLLKAHVDKMYLILIFL